MMISPYVFKSRAVRALKGNWQTALLVSFFASLPMTIPQLIQATRLPDLTRFTDYAAMQAALAAVPHDAWVLLGLFSGLSLVLTPVLTLGCNYYFIRRLHGEEPGFKGLFARAGSFGKALLLYLLIYVKTFLWSLLLIVPGVMAALRYAMAPMYLADDPSLSVTEAMNRSKQTMKDKKLSLFMLELSFVVWLLGAMLMETLLAGMSIVLALVASQFIQLTMATYLNAAVAGFYLAAAAPQGMSEAQTEAAMWLRSMGGYAGANRRPFGSDDNSAPENGDADEPTAPEEFDPGETGAEDAPEHGGVEKPAQAEPKK